MKPLRIYANVTSINSDIIVCKKCPRLVKWREAIARKKTKRFSGQEYWGKPVPSFGDAKARVLVVGLAPAAHGGNRTGRVFTGDESANWLYRALHKSGFANQPHSTHRGDGLKLSDCYITAVCHCAPPQNKLLLKEINNCRPFMLQELQHLKNIRVVVGLGKVGFDAVFDCLRELGWTDLKARPKFGHGVSYRINDNITLLGSYHPSQQNTFTGKLTEAMLNEVFQKAKGIAQ
ncbi:MAG: uracil-DNA glycosylase [Bacteroidota bacterium]